MRHYLLYTGTSLLLTGILGLGWLLLVPAETLQAGNPREISFSTIEKTAFERGIPGAANHVVNDVEAWERLWKHIYPNDLGRPDLYPVMFASSTVLAVFQGEKPGRGHYYIEVSKILDGKEQVTVVLNHFSPGKTCAVSPAHTYPFHIAVTRKIQKPVQFEVVKKIRDC